MPRIVSLVPSLTAALIDLGRDGAVVGRTRFCPPGSGRSFRVVGGTKDPDVEAIRQLGPDLVLAVREENPPGAIEELKAAGIAVVVFDPVRVEDAVGIAWMLGRLAEEPEAGEAMAERVAGAISRAREGAEGRRRVRTVYLVWRKPWMAAGPDTYIADLLRACGAADVLPAGEPRYPMVVPRDLVAAGAELVLFSSEPFPFRDEHLAAFREEAGLPEGSGPALRPCRGELVGFYPAGTEAALLHAEEIIATLR